MKSRIRIMFWLSLAISLGAVGLSVSMPSHALLMRLPLVVGALGVLGSLVWRMRYFSAADHPRHERRLGAAGAAVIVMGLNFGASQLASDFEMEGAEREYDAFAAEMKRLGAFGPYEGALSERAARYANAHALGRNGQIALGSAVLSLLMLGWMATRRGKNHGAAGEAPTEYTQRDFGQAASGSPHSDPTALQLSRLSRPS